MCAVTRTYDNDGVKCLASDFFIGICSDLTRINVTSVRYNETNNLTIYVLIGNIVKESLNIRPKNRRIARIP